MFQVFQKISAMSQLEKSISVEWERRKSSSPEVSQARLNLQFHKRKMRQLQEELTSAEVWETELEVRLKRVEDKVQPPLMKFCSQVEREEGVEQQVMEESMEGEDWNEVVKIVKRRVMQVDQMDRSQLVGLVRTVLSIRNCLVEKESQEGVETMQGMARSILKQLGRSTIEWGDMKLWEVDVVRQLIREVEGVPGFVARMVDQLLDLVVVGQRERRD